ncbi:MAG: heterocycloanthracin/sonorensin family bacteriocin [Acidobacteriota bacterium]
MRHRIPFHLVLLFAFASSLILTMSPLQAQSLSGEVDRAAFPELFAAAEACGTVASPAGVSRDALVATALPLFYSVPLNFLSEGENEVIVKAFADGELYVQESFRIQRQVVEAAHEGQRQRLAEGLEGISIEALETVQEASVFEFLSDRSAVRSTLLDLSATADHGIAIEVLVNGASVSYQGWSEFLTSSGEQLREHGLPVAVQANATVFQTEVTPGGPQEFFVCGDGSCGGGTPPLGENCESCPQDCGGPCSICGNGFCGGTETCSSCPSDCGVCIDCPKDLGTVERTDFLGSTPLSTYCMDAWPGRQYYTLTQNNYKRYDVQRTEQCNGSVTETEVPGSATYFSSYCWKYTGVSCSFSYGYASPVCF